MSGSGLAQSENKVINASAAIELTVIVELLLQLQNGQCIETSSFEKLPEPKHYVSALEADDESEGVGHLPYIPWRIMITTAAILVL